ncbi:MAG: S41 family peptidase [Planctomycetales bacterium]|nr:S41 family peptidase [Planctomycetales bacterium]
MPLRNLTILLLTALVCIVCRVEAARNRYAAEISWVLDTIGEKYIEEVNERKLFEAGVHGIMEELDPYSSYMPPAENEQFNSEIEQKFGGIGVEIGVKDERLTVLSPIPGTPAHEAGLLAGDTIMAIDGTDTEGFGMNDCVKLIKGEPGTSVVLSIRHKDAEEIIDVTVQRAIIQVESVRGDRRKPNGDWLFTLESHPNIGYLRLSTFAKNSADEVRATLESLNGNVDGVIIDLRQNPGGLLYIAVEICDMFLPKGKVIVSIRGRGGVLSASPFESTEEPVCDPNLPVVLLVDKFSASASEIFAACMQDHDRATIVGQRSYGKGTVQDVIKMERGKSAMRLTTAGYWRPSEKNIHRNEDDDESAEWGVKPKPEDTIEIDDESYIQLWRQRYRRDSRGHSDDEEAAESIVDPFLQRAVDVILGTESKREDASDSSHVAA